MVLAVNETHLLVVGRKVKIMEADETTEISSMLSQKHSALVLHRSRILPQKAATPVLVVNLQQTFVAILTSISEMAIGRLSYDDNEEQSS